MAVGKELVGASTTQTGTAAGDSEEDGTNVGNDDDGDEVFTASAAFCGTTEAGILTGTDSPLGDSTIT